MTEPLDQKTEHFVNSYRHKDGSLLNDAEKDAMRDMIIRGRTYELSPKKPSPAPKPLPPPVRNPEISVETVGKYAILESIGEGASAYVFKGRLLPGEFGPQFAAVKFPKHSQAVADLESRETILSALCDSPYSPRIVDKGMRNGQPFVAEEFREKTLAQLITENE